jgi:phosphoribulokinase
MTGAGTTGHRFAGTTTGTSTFPKTFSQVAIGAAVPGTIWHRCPSPLVPRCAPRRGTGTRTHDWAAAR